LSSTEDVSAKNPDDIFSIEQAPQLISLLNPEEIEWKYNSIIIGPDGTEIQTRGSKRDKKYYYLSPIHFFID